MSQDNKITIRLHVYDTNLSVSIDREDEEQVRKAARRVTEIVGHYMERSQGNKTEKEILCMALVQIALELQMQEARNDTAPFSDTIVKLTEELKEMLNND